MIEVTVLGQFSAILGEGPLYHEGNFFWVDIIGSKVFILDKNNESRVIYEGNQMMPTSVVPIAGSDDVAITLEDGFYRLSPNGRISELSDFKIDSKFIRFNDAKCDRLGRYWAGTMDRIEAEALGSLYCLDKGDVSRVLDKVITSNGFCWSADSSSFYYIDSPRKRVVVYDLDFSKVRLKHKRVVYEVREEGVFPDGMTIDNKGNLWVALWNGYSVICIDPTEGRVIEKIDVPCRKVTSCCFGGEDNEDLFITTASYQMKDNDWEKYPDSGKCFVARVGVGGEPGNSYKL